MTCVGSELSSRALITTVQPAATAEASLTQMNNGVGTPCGNRYGYAIFLERALREPSHELRFIPTPFVRPVVKLNRNDRLRGSDRRGGQPEVPIKATTPARFAGCIS